MANNKRLYSAEESLSSGHGAPEAKMSVIGRMLSHSSGGAAGAGICLEHGANPLLTKELQVPQAQVTLCLALIRNPKEQRLFINHLLANVSSSRNKTGLNKHEAIYSLSHLY